MLQDLESRTAAQQDCEAERQRSTTVKQNGSAARLKQSRNAPRLRSRIAAQHDCEAEPQRSKTAKQSRSEPRLCTEQQHDKTVE